MSTGRKISETETVIKRIIPYLERRGYDRVADLDFETVCTVPSRYSAGYVDILVTCGKASPQFLVEAKRFLKKLTTKDREQAIDYGRANKVPFVVVTNGQDIQVFNTNTSEAIKWDGSLVPKIPTKAQLPAVLASLKSNKSANDIGLKGDASLPYRPGLPLKQINAIFAKCHNLIRKIEKNEESAFDDFSKIFFLKLLEEKEEAGEISLPYSYRFHELAEYPDSKADQVKKAIRSMLEDIKSKTAFGDVIESTPRLAKPKTYLQIVRALSAVSFQDCTFDAKGAAFEYYVRATLKGKKLGQYFTPRPLVHLMWAIVGKPKISATVMSGEAIKVHDPACGTGGFLVFLMQEALAQLKAAADNKSLTAAALKTLRQRVMRETFYGSDANPAVACAAKMNMIVGGDGHTNIQSEDSLTLGAKNWSIAAPDCDIIITNPPFGTTETDSLVDKDLAQFPITQTKGQLLFLQKMVLSTKPNGDICTVIDEGVLNTESAAQLRRWLLKRCKILTVVQLPEETFKPNKINVKASVIHFQPYESADENLDADYSIKFIKLESLGYEGSGEAIRGFDFRKLITEIEGDLVSGKGETASGYYWSRFSVGSKEIFKDATARLDVKYWDKALIAEIEKLRTAGGPSIQSINVIKTSRGASPKADLYVDGPPDGYGLVVKAGTNISKDGKVLIKGDWVEKQIFDEHSESHVSDGDILIASTGDGTLGKCAVFRGDIPATADGHVTIVRVDQTKICPEYVCDYLRVGFGAEQIARLFTGSTGLIELTPSHVDAVVLPPLPDRTNQEKASQELRAGEHSFAQRVEDAQKELSAALKSFRKLTA